MSGMLSKMGNHADASASLSRQGARRHADHPLTPASEDGHARFIKVSSLTGSFIVAPDRHAHSSKS